MKPVGGEKEPIRLDDIIMKHGSPKTNFMLNHHIDLAVKSGAPIIISSEMGNVNVLNRWKLKR